MFHFPALPSAALCIQAGTTPHDGCRVSPFGHPRITTRLPVPRGFSQAPTSFFGSWCQDIHRMLLETWLILHNEPHTRFARRLDARVHYAVLKIRTEPQRTKPPIRRAVRPGRSRKRASQRLLPQDPTACPEASRPLALVPKPRRERTNRAAVPQRQPNSQCSTRKHGRPPGHPPGKSAGAP